MRVAKNWRDYELLDATDGERLERWGKIILIRPDPQIIWRSPKRSPLWERAHARYLRSREGGGEWRVFRPMPDVWTVGYGALRFRLKPMGFKHTGLFPEQAVNWDFMIDAVRRAGRPIRVLNLFGYTGGASLACASAGATVVHVDASRGMTAWGKENAAVSGMASLPVRWIVDDCVKFVRREERRKNVYDAVVMDPPSFGRGPGGEVWKLEEQIYSFVRLCARLLSDDPLFFMINSYAAGLSPSVMRYILSDLLLSERGGTTRADEIGLPVSSSGFVLPCGSAAVWQSAKATKNNTGEKHGDDSNAGSALSV